MAIQNRYEFMYYVACTNSNPNGDPDMGNMPRIDPQTMQGSKNAIINLPQRSSPRGKFFYYKKSEWRCKNGRSKKSN